MSRLDPRLLLQCYAAGIFPMADSRDAAELFWVEPRTRAIMPLDGLHMSRSLRRVVRLGRFQVTRDRDFAGVIRACANREETWINDEIEHAMVVLHASGHAHSIEVWTTGDAVPVLVGGLYGVRLGRAFFGESMFSTATDASKVALAWLVARLKVGGFTLLDCQFMTDHLASLGAISVPRADYIRLLSAALGGGTAGAATAPLLGVGAGITAPASAGSATAAADFTALDRLLDATGAAGAPGPAGYVIAQLLGQTS
ncbi:leucyl/phenylalanyl-tRNA--protein transferase [Sphingomonas sp.]|uniref:leucyl/phenylalanyl-tRNA--protein transferase n=1 Tax=Sphingomonas sp. TaxID=28214 RepID=UPI00286C5BED|nr:leucyl/phenylalanyl-tRNA--protein transferase [Sphingomonas sp.]